MSRAPKEILVIDDDDSILLLVNNILTTAGYRVHEASSIAQAMQVVDKRVPHLVITDLKLSGESGFEYLERHRRLKEGRNVPVLVLSSVRALEAVYQATSLGAVDYVTKPIDAQVLVNKVKKALKDRKFPHYALPQGQRPVVQLSAPAKIVQANEIGFLLEAPVRIAEGARVEISSPLVREIGCESCIFHRTKLPSRPGFPGQYLNDIAVVGLTSTHALRIRQIMSKWK